MLWPLLMTMISAASDDPIDALLDGMHRASASADGPAYFGSFTDDAVFIGTDPTERWDLAAFRAYALPRFTRGQGWSYTPLRRSVTMGPGRRVAWFDETLEHAQYGQLRGSGVAQRDRNGWRVARYVLSFSVTNDTAGLTVAANKGEAWLPTPYTAAQIQAAMPIGLQTRWEQTDAEGATSVTQWRVVGTDADGVTLEHGPADAPQGESGNTWTSLRDHARFPAAHTAWDEQTVRTPAGEFACRRYTVQRGAEVHTFWFAPSLPGPPVRMTVAVDGAVSHTSVLLERTPPG